MAVERGPVDMRLIVTDRAVTVSCQRCPWVAEVTSAPADVDIVRQARLDALEHAWSEHHIHAWDLTFRYMW